MWTLTEQGVRVVAVLKRKPRSQIEWMPRQSFHGSDRHLYHLLVGLNRFFVSLVEASLSHPAHGLEQFLTPDEIVETPLPKLAELINQVSRKRVADPEQVAEVVKQAAKRSYRLGENLIAPVNLVLSSSLNTIRTCNYSGLPRASREIHHSSRVLR